MDELNARLVVVSGCAWRCCSAAAAPPARHNLLRVRGAAPYSCTGGPNRLPIFAALALPGACLRCLVLSRVGVLPSTAAHPARAPFREPTAPAPSCCTV